MSVSCALTPDREGAIGVAAANRDRQIEVARNEAASAKGQKQAEADRRVFIQQQEATAVEGENVARADIARTNAAGLRRSGTPLAPPALAAGAFPRRFLPWRFRL